MKRLTVLAIALLLSMSLLCVFAEDRPLAIKEASAGVKTDGEVGLTAGEYLLFRAVDFTNVKSVRITGEPNWTSGWSGDIFRLRIDNVRGKVIGYVDFDQEGKHTFGTNVSVSGTHDLYIQSLYAQDGAAKISAVSLSDEAMPEKTAYVPVPEEALVDTFADTWAATSGLGRKVADYDEVGGPKEGRQVGLFYWNWNVNQETTVNVINNTTFQKEHPEAYREDGYHDPAWPAGKTVYFLDEPLYGYYAGNDYWVYRKDAELLADAGVDFIFLDYTNGRNLFRRNMEALCEAFHDAKAEGADVPKIVIAGNMAQPIENTKFMLQYLYLYFYKQGAYSDLWYYWEGKPLILAHDESLEAFLDPNDSEDIALVEEIEDFFTFRGIRSDWEKAMTQMDNKWTISEKYPQRTFGKDSQGRNEMVIVQGANNRSIETELLAPMSTPYTRGKNYTEVFGHDYTEGAHLYNYYFEEQMAGALATDAQILMISSWNEWTAGRQENYIGKFKNSFIDHFDHIQTRDLALSAGSQRDNGFMLLCDAIRKWKGVRPTPTASAPVAIDMENAASWDAVEPTYYNAKGAYVRDSDSYAELHYENDTARNNIKRSKVARDSEFVWFMAETASPLSGGDTDNFMTLYINVDRNHATGWEGFDFRVRKKAVEAWQGAWTAIGTADTKIDGARYQVKLSRALLGIVDPVDLEFKWADNSDDSDLLNFYTTGITAPAGRFNYVYTEKAPTTLTEKERQAASGMTVVKEGSTRAVVRGGLMPVFEADTRYGVRGEDGTAYLPATVLKDAIRYGTTKILFENDRSFLKIDTEQGMAYTTAGSLLAVYEGREIALSHPVKVVDGIPYVPLTLMSEVFGYQTINLGGGAWAFGDALNEEAAHRAAQEL